MTSLRDIEFQKMDGTAGTLADHAGEVVLVVNVASKCGLTPQYETLEKLYEDKRADGFTMAPVRDPIRNIVYYAQPGDLAEVVVDGRTLVEEGVVVGADVAALTRGVQRAGERVWSRWSSGDWAGRSLEEVAPQTFRQPSASLIAIIGALPGAFQVSADSTSGRSRRSHSSMASFIRRPSR